MKRFVYALAGLAVFGAAAFLFAVTPATGATSSSVESGWWTEASAGGVAAPSPTPSNDLEVSYGLQGPLSFAAVRFTVPSGATSSSDVSLTLAVASSVGTPAVSACPTTSAWKAGGDQPYGAAPAYSCKGKQADGNVSGSNEAWTFPVTWASKGTISVALVPTVGTQVPFSQEFNDPTAASISVVQPSNPASSFPSAPAPVSSPAPAAASPPAAAAPASSPSASVSPSGPASALPPSLGPVGSTPVAPSSQAPGSSASRAIGAPAQQAAGGGVVKPPSRRAGRIMALIILLATGAALFLLASRSERAPRKLGSLGGQAGTGGQVVVQPVTGGIGRFARPRIGPPKRI